MIDRSKFKLDVQRARDAIAGIRSLDLTAASIEEIKELLTAVFRGYQARAPIVNPGVRLFRMQLCDKPTNIARLLYPPRGVAGLGRANRPGESQFYCSTVRQAPFFEARPAAGATAVIGEWETTARCLVNHVGYTTPAFGTLGASRLADTALGPAAGNPAGTDNQEVTEFLAEEFIARIGTGEEHRYKVTVAVAEKLASDDMFEGLMYPTVPMRGNADNFALKPRFVDASMRFVRTEFVRIGAVHDDGMEYTVVDTATKLGDDRVILWNGRPWHWRLTREGEQLTVRAEGGRWVARDAQGNIVEPT